MVTSDENLVHLKHKIMEETCRLAWKKAINEKTIHDLIFEIIPGTTPQFRCCVYKERAIVAERIQLSLANDLRPDTHNVVQVIEPACDQCSISAYSVTDNCRFCIGKPCQNSCAFDAITPGEFRMHIDSNKCKECGKCAEACPFGAIVHLLRPCKKACPVGAITYDENGVCQIDDSKCIHCGHCIHSCPFGAIGSKTYLVNIIKDILAGKEVIAMVAPSIEGQFGEDISLDSIRDAMKKIGFADMVEVGLGGDMTAAYEAEEWSEARKAGKKMTTSCCPAFKYMMKKHFPDQYNDNMSTTVSPMCAVSRYLKATHPGCVTVFIGPCIAKKSETMETSLPGNADYAVTFGELRALMRSKDIKFEPHEAEYQESSVFGKKFATSGGVANAVIEVMNERGEDTTDIKLNRAAGGDACKKALMMLKAGKLQEDFIEGMICDSGCVGGPSKHRTEREIMKARASLLSKADGRKILDNLKDYPMEKFSMHKETLRTTAP